MLFRSLPGRHRPRTEPGQRSRCGARGLPTHWDDRGHRHAARRRAGRLPRRSRGHARAPGGVPGQGSRRDGQHVPYPAAGGRQAHRRQGSLPAVPAPDLELAGERPDPGRCGGAGRSARGHQRRADVLRSAAGSLRRHLVLVRRPVHRALLGPRLKKDPPFVIDFRYHIVSLISVFLALAVGIVLGAGPLRDSIADELTGQVDQLRTEKEALRVELDAAQQASQDRRTFITEAAPRLLSDALTDRSVALVELPGADEDVTEAVAARLEQAEATVVGTVTITDTWVDSSQDTFRSGIAQNLVPSMNPAPAADAPSDLVLAQALGQALTLRDPDQTSDSSAEATQMLERSEERRVGKESRMRW